MNRLPGRAWFFPVLGTVLYLAGFNDALLHEIGVGWLRLGRWPQTALVVILLAIIAYFVNDYGKQRRSAYRAAVRAASLTDGDPSAATNSATV